MCGLYLDDEATEYPVAYITTAEPAHKHAQLVADVADFVAGQVAQYKRLRAGVQVLDAIPKKYVRSDLQSKKLGNGICANR